MSTEQPQPVTPPSTQDTTWGAPPDAQGTPQQEQKRSGKKLAVALVVALGIAGAGAGVVYAASDGSSSTTEQSGPGGGMNGGPGGDMGGGPGVLSEALHGEYVVSDGDGGYTTELLQNGEVTAISDTSITAESEDGYTRTYTIGSDTTADLSDIGTGDDVTIVATVSGDVATVESVVEEGTEQRMAPPDQSQDGDSTSQGG